MSSDNDNLGNGEGEIMIKFNILSKDKIIQVITHPEAQLKEALADVYAQIPKDSKITCLFGGARLNVQDTIQQCKLINESTVQIIVQSQAKQQQQNAIQNANITFRGGFEALLEADVPREDVIRQRLVFLARTGYLAQEQLQILYMNSELLPPPRGYTSPRPQSVRQIFINELRRVLQINYDFQQPLVLTQQQVQLLYPNQENPGFGQPRPSTGLSMISFALMFLEACIPDSLAVQLNLINFNFVTHQTSLPTVPLRAMQLEITWNNNQTNNQNLQQLAQQENLMGPHQAVIPVNRVLSSFQRLLTMVVGVLLGLVFNILILPFAMHESMTIELRMGVFLGLIGNIFFALFIGLAGIV